MRPKQKANAMRRTTQPLAEGLTFPESPRWHADELWFLDLPTYSLHAVSFDGRHRVVETFEHRPSSFDFLPDGTPVVAFREAMHVVRLDDHSVHADLRSLASHGVPFEKFGDMVVDGRGRIYVGCVLPPGTAANLGVEPSDAVAIAEPDGAARLVSTNVDSPNGIAVSPDGGRLILTESHRRRLTEWELTEAGDLISPKTFADLGAIVPDGICLDSEAHAWVAGLEDRRVVRVGRGGTVTDSIRTSNDRFAIATALGGPSRNHLFVLTCETPLGRLTSWEDCLTATGYVEVIEVDVPRGGWPSN